MRIAYDIELCDSLGRHISPLNDAISFVAVLTENDVGALTLVVPARYPLEWFQKDGWIKIRRGVRDRPLALLGGAIWLIEQREISLADDGSETITIEAQHQNHLLKRRIVAYAAGSAYTAKTDLADDMIKAVARENMGTLAVDTDRAYSSTLFAVEASTGLGPTIDKAFSRRNVLAVCQEIAATAATLGTYLGFEIAVLNESTFELRTYINQRGVDRTSGVSFVLLGPDYGSLGNVALRDDWSDEATFVYAGGKGEGVNRPIATAQDTALIAASPFGRVERFENANNTDDSAVIEDVARQALYQHRLRRVFTGQIIDTPGVVFGIHYNWGDLVVAEYRNQRYTCRVNPIKISMLQDQGEQIDARLRYDSAVA